MPTTLPACMRITLVDLISYSSQTFWEIRFKSVSEKIIKHKITFWLQVQLYLGVNSAEMINHFGN